MSRPLAAHDADKPASGIYFNHIVASQFLGIGRIFRSHKWPRAGKAADNVICSGRLDQIWVEVAKHVINILLRDYQLGIRQDCFIGGSDQQSASPWDGE